MLLVWFSLVCSIIFRLAGETFEGKAFVAIVQGHQTHAGALSLRCYLLIVWSIFQEDLDVQDLAHFHNTPVRKGTVCYSLQILQARKVRNRRKDHEKYNVRKDSGETL